MGRDFLVHESAKDDSFLHGLSDQLAVQNKLLAEIVRNQRRIVPTIRTTTVVHNTNLNGSITDTNPHKITFEIGGKPVTVHKILIGGSLATEDRIRFSLEPAQYSYAMTIPFMTDVSATPFSQPAILNMSVSELYVVYLNANAHYVNAPGPSGDIIWIYGWTDDDWPNFIL